MKRFLNWLESRKFCVLIILILVLTNLNAISRLNAMTVRYQLLADALGQTGDKLRAAQQKADASEARYQDLLKKHLDAVLDVPSVPVPKRSSGPKAQP